MTKTIKPDDVVKLTKVLQTAHTPVDARADFLIYNVTEAGLDMKPAITSLLQEADEGRALKAKAAEDDHAPLSPETFIGPYALGGKKYAVVTTGQSDIYLPCCDDDLKDIAPGDPILVDIKNARIVGKNGEFPHPGDVVLVDALPKHFPGHVVVKHQDRPVLARLAQRLIDAETPPKPGTRVVYDPVRRFVSDQIETQTDGDELLTSVNTLAEFSRRDLGAPHPILNEMLFRMKMWVNHPEWMHAMRPRSA